MLICHSSLQELCGKEGRRPPWVFRRCKATGSAELQMDQTVACLPVLAKLGAFNVRFSRKVSVLLPTLLLAWLSVDPLGSSHVTLCGKSIPFSRGRLIPFSNPQNEDPDFAYFETKILNKIIGLKVKAKCDPAK